MSFYTRFSSFLKLTWDYNESLCNNEVNISEKPANMNAFELSKRTKTVFVMFIQPHTRSFEMHIKINVQHAIKFELKRPNE